MKYCKICGTLLEDTHEHCIRCGADMTIEENVSMYPIEVMETMEEENKRKKATGKILAMIIALVVVLVGLILFFLYGLDSSGIDLLSGMNAQTDMGYEEDFESEDFVEEEMEPEEAEEPAETPTPEPKKNKAVKDDKGFYYDYVVETDDAGNPVFTALIPEDLTEREFYKDYEGYCDRYPFTVNFTASTKENDVRFTYLSPRKLWYKISDSGRSRSDERDLTNYMSYCRYDGARSYLEPLLSQSYPGAKFEIKNEYDVSPEAVAKLEDFANAKKKELSGSIGDYARIGEGTTYANMNCECSAKVYEYEITLKDKDMLFCRYFIPSMAHTLAYACTSPNDKGEVTEWYNFAIICFETGNEDEFDDYEEAFDLFVANALPTDMFMYINESYSKEILSAISAGKSPDPLDDAHLKKYGSAFTPSTKLDDFDTKVMDILRSAKNTCFSNADAAVYTSDSIKCAYYDKAKGKVFISPDADEYPGDSFEELTAAGSPSDAAGDEPAEPEAEEAPMEPEEEVPEEPAGGII
ncbi:MAG: hypothetical protein K6F73_11130 [Lachnospiraceae bacterium]|nr:hypothetical protein [Lachnospiraceae bacterium]